MVDAQTIAHMTRNEADMAFKKRVQTIFEWIPPHDDMRILDCACGRGFYLNMYRHVSRCELVGLELDDEIIRNGLGPDYADKMERFGVQTDGQLDRYVRVFQRAQRKVERKHLRDRKMLLHHEKERKKMQREMGQDPFLDTAE